MFNRSALVLAVAILLAPLPALAEATRLTLVLLCDMYDLGPKQGRGGYAKVAGVVAAERAKGGNVFVAHAGDAFSPTLLSSFDRAEHVVALLNAIRPDVFVPGNHEFDFGPELFRQRVSELRIPVLAANLREPGGAAVANVADSRMLEMDGVRVGVVGLTAQDSPQKSRPGDLVFLDTVETLEVQAKRLRADGADLVVAVVHGDRGIDRRIVASGAVDVLLSGDDHDLWLEYDGRTAAVEAKQDGEYLVAVDLAIEVKPDGGKRVASWWPRFRVIDTADVAPDAGVAEMVAGYEAALSQELDVELARTETELDSRNAAVRAGEAAIGNLYADAIRAATGADVALLNGGGFRGNRVYPAGSAVTRRDVLKELPFGNKTVVVEIRGDELRRALEHGLAELSQPNGRFPQVSGMRVEAARAQASGSRLVKVEIAGKAIDDKTLYKLATHDFLTRGGDGYTMLAGARVLTGGRDGKLTAADVMTYLRRQGTISPRVEGRVAVR